ACHAAGASKTQPRPPNAKAAAEVCAGTSPRMATTMSDSERRSRPSSRDIDISKSPLSSWLQPKVNWGVYFIALAVTLLLYFLYEMGHLDLDWRSVVVLVLLMVALAGWGA